MGKIKSTYMMGIWSINGATGKDPSGHVPLH